MAKKKNFPNLMTCMNQHILEAQKSSKLEKHKEIHTETRYSQIIERQRHRESWKQKDCYDISLKRNSQ